MSKLQNLPDLALYHYPACPFCAWTRATISSLGFDVELRDIQKSGTFRKQLMQGGGKRQVPCLRIEENGEVSWLYESEDIIRYVQRLSTSLAKSA